MPRSPKDEVLCFGIYVGKTLGSVPESYLRWMVHTLRHGKWEWWSTLAHRVLEGDSSSSDPAPFQSKNLGDAVEALEHWNGPLDAPTYAYLLNKCGSSKALLQGKCIHHHITRHWRGDGTFLGNVLVQMYGKCGDVVSALSTFLEMSSPNIYSWNIIVSAFAQNGHLQDARRMFEQMAIRDVISWTSMLKAYAEEGHMEEAKLFFDAMPVRDAISWNVMISAFAQNGDAGHDCCKTLFDESPTKTGVTWNAMMQACSLNGQVHDAKLVFDRMPCRDLISWNAMLSAYAREGHMEAALCLLEESPQQDIITWTHMIDGYGQSGNLQEARRLFEQVSTRDSVCWATLMQAYVRAGYVHEAGKILERMPQHMLATCNTMIQAHAQSGHMDFARQAFERIPVRNVLSETIMLRAFGVNGQLAEAKELFDSMPGRNNMPWSAMVQVYAQNGYMKEAVSTFYRMPQQDSAAWTATINVYGDSDQVENARRMFDEMPRRNPLAWNAMISAYAQNRQVDQAGTLFLCMPHWSATSVNTMIIALAQNGLVQDARAMFDELPQKERGTWTVMLVAYDQHGHSKEALQLFRLMDLEGVRPDRVAYVRVLDACANLSAVTEARLIHSSILDNNLESDPDVATALIETYGSCNLLEEARLAFDQMHYKDQQVWSTMIGVCAQKGRGKEALKLLDRMYLEGVKADTNMSFIDAYHDLTPPRNVGGGSTSNHQVMDALGESGNAEDRRGAFDSGSERELSTWTTMLETYLQNGDGQHAVDLFQLMALHGVMPSKRSFTNILSACRHSGLLNDGLNYFASASRDYELDMVMEDYACIIELLGRAGKLDEAECVIQSMPLEPDSATWSTLLAACKTHRDVHRGLRALEHLSKL